jgi:hypothetical protein
MSATNVIAQKLADAVFDAIEKHVAIRPEVEKPGEPALEDWGKEFQQLKVRGRKLFVS